MLKLSTRATMREPKPMIRSAPPKNSMDATRAAFAWGKGIPSDVKNWVTRARLWSFPHPVCMNCQPQYKRTTNKNGDCKEEATRARSA